MTRRRAPYRDLHLALALLGIVGGGMLAVYAAELATAGHPVLAAAVFATALIIAVLALVTARTAARTPRWYLVFTVLPSKLAVLRGVELRCNLCRWTTMFYAEASLRSLGRAATCHLRRECPGGHPAPPPQPIEEHTAP